MPTTRPCPVCGGSEARPFLQKGELRLMRCLECSMVFANPVPPEFAGGSYYDQAGASYYLSPEKLESDYAPVRFERELRLFRAWCPGGKVLDVGCSTGAFLFHLNQRFPGAYQVLGTDVSGPALDFAESKGIPVLRGNFLGQPPTRQGFDAVTFWAVLEHLADPAAFLDQARRILRPGGVCFVLVPNAGSLAARVLGARYRYIYPQHLNYFSRATLTRLVGARFEVLAVKSMHFNPAVIWQDWRRGGREVSNAERAALLQRTTALKQKPLLQPLKVLYRLGELMLGAVNLADNLAVVARKRE